MCVLTEKDCSLNGLLLFKGKSLEMGCLYKETKKLLLPIKVHKQNVSCSLHVVCTHRGNVRFDLFPVQRSVTKRQL